MTRIIDMEVSVPRFDVGDDQAHTEPGRGAPAVDTERPAGYGMANYARIFKARQAGAEIGEKTAVAADRAARCRTVPSATLAARRDNPYRPLSLANRPSRT